MALGEWTITVRCDFNTKQQEETFTKFMKGMAKSAHSTCALLADKRKPQIAFQHGDMFAGSDEIELWTETGEDGEEA